MTDAIFLLTVTLVTVTVLWRAAEARANRAEKHAAYLASRLSGDDVPAYAVQGEGYRASLRIVKGGRS